MMNLFYAVIGFIVGACICGLIDDCRHIDVGNKVI